MLWDVVVMAQQSGTASGYRLGSIRYEHHSKKQRERVERSFCICRERAAVAGGCPVTVGSIE